MLKTIFWNNTFHIIGPNTLIEIEKERISIVSNFGYKFLPFKESPALQKRLQSDDLFKKQFHSLVGQVIAHFLAQDTARIADLADILIRAEINADSPKEEVKEAKDANG